MFKSNTTYLAVVLAVVCFFSLFLLGTAEASEGDTVSVTVNRLNFRLGPGTEYHSMDLLEEGTEAEVLAQKDGWLLVRLSEDGRTGWLYATYTTPDNPDSALSLDGIANAEITTSNLNIRMGPGLDYTSFDLLPRDTRVKILAEENGWLLVQTEYSSTGWIYSEYTRTVTEEVSVTASKLNVRSGPGTEFEVLEQFARGTQVDAIMEKDGWLRLTLSDLSTGWISSAYTTTGETADGGSSEPLSDRGSRQYLAGRTVVVDPGHGGYDPGAVGVTGLQEKVVAMQTANKVANYLRAQGAEVIMTRSGDYFVSLARRVQISNNNGADIFVSIHANSHPSSYISGTETYYYAYGSNASSSRYLAGLVQNELVNDSGLRNIGVKHGNFHVIRNTWMPSILVELGFLSNWHDESLLKQDSHLDGQAQAITRGIINCFN